MTRPAAASTAGLCVTTSTAWPPAARRRSVPSTCVSDAGSRPAVGSSSSTTGRPQALGQPVPDAASRARASATRRRWPADRPLPRSPTAPPSRISASAAARAAASTSPSAASGLPRRMLLATVPGNRTGSWGSQATRERQPVASISARSTPPSAPWMITRPEAGRANPSRTASSVDLPQPLWPHSAVISPRATVSETRSGAGRGRPG